MGQMRSAGLVTAIVLALGLTCWVVLALLRGPVFALRTVEVSGAKHLDVASVHRLAGVATATPLPSINTRAVRDRLERDPWIVEARVYRDYPGTLRVEIVERRALAIVDGGGTKLDVIAADGTWLGRRTVEETGLVVVRDLGPVVVTPGKRTDSRELLNALRLIAGLSPQLKAMVKSVSASSIEKTLVLTKSDVEIFFGEATDMRTKDRIARELLAKYKDKVVYINVRVVESPTWRGLEQAP